ncbi:CASP8-associated protein 2 [Betta splendens]|uniref:CASP8-associated protein 2 n=1 Tax=Betta splendens TaxID=158456 RepID=A0A6P7LTT5_BETSP|nr:CASP8-associated protein 2 [Betta splendens]
MANPDISDASRLLLPEVSEDSVDIYDDLDVCFNIDAGKTPQESMDLYEEIVTEEQLIKESSYAELKSRFEAAQNQIKELHRRLEEMETKNTRLNTENCSLKKNISALFRTAKQEVTRKDAEILRLNLGSVKGHNIYTNNLPDRNLSSRPLASSPPPPSTNHPPARENYPPKHSCHLSKKENNNCINRPTISSTETRASKESSACHSKSLSILQNESDKHKLKHREEKYQCLRQSQSPSEVWRQRSGSDSNKDSSAPDKTRSHKVDNDARRNYNSRTCLSRTYPNAEGHHKVDRAKSPCQDILDSTVRTGRSRELKKDNDNSEYGGAYSSKEHHSSRKSYRCDRGSNSKVKKRSSSNQKRYRDSSKDREGARFSKNYQKAEKRHEEKVGKYRRKSLSETSRESRRQSTKKLEKSDIHDSSKDKQKNKRGISERSSNNKIFKKGSTEGNAPNKKLCFMETLNLTLSPIKKSTVSIDEQHEPAGDMVHHQSDDENSQPNVEDMCIIDEIGSGQSEGVPELTSDIPAHTGKSCESAKDFQKDTNNYNKKEVEKTLEDTSVKTTLAHTQSLDMGQNYITDPTLKSQQSSFIKPQNQENRMELTSENEQVQSAPLEATSSINNTFRSMSKPHTSSSSEQGYLVISGDQPVAIIETFVLKSREEKLPKTTVWTSLPVNAVEDGPNNSPSRKNPVNEDVSGCFKSQCMPSDDLPQSCQQGLSALFRPVYRKTLCHKQCDPKETETVSSTISMASFPQEGLSLPEAIHVLTEETEVVGDSLAHKLSSSTSCTGVSKVSSTTEDLVVPKNHMSKCSELNVTQNYYNLAKSYENNVEPSTSVLVLHDEDSMIRTLNNLKRFPDAISPLKSPIRITKTKQSHLHNQGNPDDVKSLQTDFSDTANGANSKKLEVNKENKYPGSTADSDMHVVDEATDHFLSFSDTDMEEGEILSESEESVPDYPVLTTKLAMLSPPATNKPNRKTTVKRKTEDYNLILKETPGESTQSPKSRFKTVCPAATKFSFSNIDEIMETFKLVRREIRKKYMKLHKTFPKKSFYGMMDNFQKSFLEFVEGAQFGKICSQAEELKSRLKKLITSVFSKVANNGIVKRIFEQQATDLKQKLWDFVDVQVEYLFKDINTTLKCLCKPASPQAKDVSSNWNENMSTQPPVKKEFQSASPISGQVKTSAVVPYRTGLGSRGKDIRMTHMENPTSSDPSPSDIQKTQTKIDIHSTKNIPPTPEQNNLVSLIVSQNNSLNDKTDFNILTEQQASSLTFNLVRDSQMGEIFKCLLQGSDLLESSGITGDYTAWPLSTPRKDGERLISITTPTKFHSPSKFFPVNKFNSPSKLIATWSSISPRNMPSPRSNDPVALNPALFDESCLLEVPSENSVPLQKSHYVLAEDLAVSLTIPSPLKSDSHLSFLQPASIHRMSTPDSVISAHISEDALLDNEDITEQDIHLTLDTDNSSCGSISSVASVPCLTSFMFQPDKPMQALVMEKSNDHFIVKIRQAELADVPLVSDDSLSKTFGAENMIPDSLKESQTVTVFQSGSSPSDSIPSVQHDLAKISGLSLAITQEKCSIKDLLCQNEVTITHQNISKISISEELQPLNDQPSRNTLNTDSQNSHSVCYQFSKITDKKDVTLMTDEFETDAHHRGENPKTQKSSFKPVTSAPDNNPHLPAESCKSNQRSKDSLKQSSDLAREDKEASKCERNLVIESTSCTPETEESGGENARKRKKHQEKSKAKRCKKEAKRTEAPVSTKDNNESSSSSAHLSTNSLSARNVIRKKGEVVMAWTRDEDRAILIDLKKKGPSRETFSALSEKLKKPTGQIAHRFYQLMKLFKKQEKV